MFRIFHENRLLFLFYFLFLMFSGCILFSFGKLETHLMLTRYNTFFLDQSVRFLTFLGDGAFMVTMGVFLLFRKIRYGLTILSSFVFSTLLVQTLKRLIFAGYKRPVAWFHDLGIELHHIEGVQYYSSFSFPSGHSTTAFALFFSLAFFIRSGTLKLLLLLLAIITGFTRIYLSQHFLGDVLAGSLLGTGSAVLMQLVFERFDKKWLDVPLNRLKSIK